MNKKANELIEDYKSLVNEAKLRSESLCNGLSHLSIMVKESKEKYLSFLRFLKKIESFYLEVLEICRDNNIDTADIDDINNKIDAIRGNLFKVVSDIEMDFMMEDN